MVGMASTGVFLVCNVFGLQMEWALSVFSAVYYSDILLVDSLALIPGTGHTINDCFYSDTGILCLTHRMNY